MTERRLTPRSITHGSFSLERTYDAPCSAVFAAFASEAAKAAWFHGGEGYAIVEKAFDFREGGQEVLVGQWDNGTVTRMDLTYFDIVPDERIVYAYEMTLNGTKISVSLATIEFKRAGAGARLQLTETGAYLDGYDDAGSREHGTNAIIDRLAGVLAKVPA
ncbi:SRPBCC domain-containing protein [Phenylobacterium sp.]|uniref:SRPBCC domain-containing protein n=1 Tax=Phenylobacterium sp. TaxID=1871053 RepID=UPI002DEA784D|nr:SRPBCC domain-containing protein [Phenylobacterium sp.]